MLLVSCGHRDSFILFTNLKLSEGGRRVFILSSVPYSDSTSEAALFSQHINVTNGTTRRETFWIVCLKTTKLKILIVGVKIIIKISTMLYCNFVCLQVYILWLIWVWSMICCICLITQLSQIIFLSNSKITIYFLSLKVHEIRTNTQTYLYTNKIGILIFNSAVL
jgi:uncharacterized membrane protein YhaH (DUF805 family)